MLFTTKNLDPKYNNASAFQIALFSLNSAATTLYLVLMEYVAYYINGIVGFTVVFASALLTALRVFDGLIDPMIGFIVDRSQGRFGKFRPFMVLGNLLMLISVLLMFNTTHLVPDALCLPYFVLVYVIYVFGYTFQMIVAKSGQTVMTDNPKMRPLTSYFDSLFVTSCYGGAALYASAYLVPKYGGYTNPALFREFTFAIAGLSIVCTILGVIGIWNKDRPEYYNAEGAVQKIRLRDYWEVLRHNKPIRQLVASASVNKFTSTVYNNITVCVMLFGIMMQNYAMAGEIGLLTIFPNLIVVTLGVTLAQRIGQKHTYTLFMYAAIVLQIIQMFFLIRVDISGVSFSNLCGTTVAFMVIYILLNGAKSVSNSIVVPMIADCSDYEVYRSGMYVPGFMGALFALVDQVISSLATIFVGLMVAMIGFTDVLPQVDDPVTPELKTMTVFMYCVVPLLGWVFSLIVMHNYELDKNKMQEINRKKHQRRKLLHDRLNRSRKEDSEEETQI